jgi:hypothetical protein
MRKYSLFLALGLLVSPGSLFAADPGIARLTDGLPSLAERALDASAYAPQVAKKLAKPRLLYVNYELLTKMLIEEGVQVPVGGITEAMKKEFVDHVAYMIPSKLDPPGAFLDISKTFFADRYGGLGMNGNHGSGRAMAAGKVQTKGGGPTTLIGAHVDEGHRNGAINAVEGVHEAMWGEVLHHELPHGANRTIAIIDTGTDFTAPDGQVFARAIAIREDPLRPAHYMRNPDATKELGVVEDQHLKGVLGRLADALPQKPGTAALSEGEKIRAGLNNFIERVADQYSTSWADSLYHGATSPSNILLDGRMIDFGTQTSMSGYQRIQQIIEDGEGPSGDTMPQKTELFHNILDNFRENLPPSLRKFVPSKAEGDALYDQVYRRAMDRNMLRLSGAPTELLGEVASKPEGQKLARLVERIAKAGNEKPVLGEMPVGNPGKYELGKVLQTAAEYGGGSEKELSQALQTAIPDASLRTEFARAYSRYYPSLLAEAKKAGLTAGSLKTYQTQAVPMRNRKMPDLVMYHEHGGEYYAPLWDLLHKSRATNDPNLVQNFIDQRVAANRRTFADARPFEVVLHEEITPRTQERVRRVYDARKDRYLTIRDSNLPNVKLFREEPTLRAGCPAHFKAL